MTQQQTDWTEQAPTQDGFYWAKKREKISSREVVELLGNPESPYVLRPGKDADETVESFEWWPTPVAEPPS